MWELLLVTLLKWVLVIGGLWVAVRFSRLVPWFKARKQADRPMPFPAGRAFVLILALVTIGFLVVWEPAARRTHWVGENSQLRREAAIREQLEAQAESTTVALPPQQETLDQQTERRLREAREASQATKDRFEKQEPLK